AVQHVAAVEGDAEHLEREQSDGRGQDHRYQPEIPEQADHAARPLTRERVRSAMALAAATRSRASGAADAAGAGAGAVAVASGRATDAICDRRRRISSPASTWAAMSAENLSAVRTRSPMVWSQSCTVGFRRAMARSGISVAVISSEMVALNDCSSALKRLRRPLSMKQ